MAINQQKQAFLSRLLSARGIHYLVRRFGWRKLRSLAFDGKYERGDWNFQRDSSELPVLVRQHLNSGDLLIMGCGGASVLEGLEAADLNSALGIDLSPEAIRLASRFASGRVSFQVSDMETFVCSGSYNVILFSESINYVPGSRQVSMLKELAGHLKGNGVFIVTLAEANRYHTTLERIRSNFRVIDDRNFPGSSRHLIVFS